MKGITVSSIIEIGFRKTSTSAIGGVPISEYEKNGIYVVFDSKRSYLIDVLMYGEFCEQELKIKTIPQLKGFMSFLK